MRRRYRARVTTTPSEATQQIDAQLAALTDWRGDLARSFRALVAEVEPALEEQWKWGTGMWASGRTLVCGYGVFAKHVKLNFFAGAALADPAGLFNNGLDAKTSRSIDLREGDALDAAAVGDLVRRAAEHARG